ncbi:hypothetical protein [Actinoplanes sp. NPDC023714]|uniref:hypothetical protein n=1 Tax=Actinoplanes sp. NPDC023714 TaxID=3154322 RepID=UPI0033EAD763
MLLGASATALWINRAQAISTLYRWFSPSPRMRDALRPVADTLVPDWRRDSGWPRSRYSAAWRISELRKLGKPPFLVVGGVYLDISIRPVRVSKLEDNEFYDLDTPVVGCGGSALHFGQELYRRAGIKSRLYTRLGKSDQLRAIIRREPWIRGRRPRIDRGGQSGVSLHLIQDEGQFHTTFTHTGVVARLSWSDIKHHIGRRAQRGGVLYIAGFFRTGLCVDLRETLARFPYKLLVCLEHGRFKAKANPSANAALQLAFEEQLVDVYLCTDAELCELMSACGLVVDRRNGPAAALTYFARQRTPPQIVVVRSRAGDGTALAHVLFGGEVFEVAGQGAPPPHGIGSKGRFMATFVHELVTGRPDEDPRRVVVHAAEQAVQSWVGHNRKERDVSPR